MTKTEFLNKVNSLNINPRWYSIDGEIKEYCYNLISENNQYKVFYLERGECSDIEMFSTIEEAFDELLKQLTLNFKYGFDLTK